MPPGIGYGEEATGGIPMPPWLRQQLEQFLNYQRPGPAGNPAGPTRADRWQRGLDRFSQTTGRILPGIIGQIQEDFNVPEELRGIPGQSSYPGAPGIGGSSPIAPDQVGRPPGLASMMPGRGGPLPRREGPPPMFPRGAGGAVGVPGGISPEQRARIQSQMIRQNFVPSQATAPVRMKGNLLQGPPKDRMSRKVPSGGVPAPMQEFMKKFIGGR